jgi:7-carboxy-7-deazaguanine synthase
MQDMNSVKQIIPADHHLTRKTSEKYGEDYLNISEFYYDTIQGEGIYAGVPAAFLRLKGCHLGCSYCDTTEVWRYGTHWSFDEIFEKIDKSILIERLKAGQHLVITGGSPMLQQDRLLNFILTFYARYKFQPFIEIENEATIMPYYQWEAIVSCWNNSPKLASSEVEFDMRYKPDIIQRFASFRNSWFKFVISDESDWNEIEDGFLTPNLIKREQIILMPEGATKEEIEVKRELVVEMAIENNVRYCTREHIVLWGKKTGI